MNGVFIMSRVILFQGDSITDCGRDRKNEGSLGSGYARYVAADLGFENPGEYEFFNRGISGNRIVDVYARIKADIINLRPDYMSLLIGVNDVWHEISRENGVDTAKFEKIYSMLIEEIKEALPDIKIMILEPYVLCDKATCSDEEHPGRWERFRADVESKAAVAKRIAEKYSLTFVPLQQKFDEMDAKTQGYWTGDGVHPTVYGHELIAREWLAAFETIK